MNDLVEAKKVFDIEIEALTKMRDSLGEEFEEVLNLIMNCEGKLIITGMGKPGHIARKLAATFSSLGTPSFYLNPADAMHGDLGMVEGKDVVMAISYSGESDEVISILPAIKNSGAQIVAITANAESTLAKNADVMQLLPEFDEACNLNLAPTSSTTVELCYGDALAVVASMRYGFQKEDFGKFHPAGALGKKLIYTVGDVMATEDLPCIKRDEPLMDAISEIARAGMGVVAVVDEDNRLEGILTDGDISKLLQKRYDIYSCKVDEVMITSPKTMLPNAMAIKALRFLNEKSIHCLPIVDEENVLQGIVTWHMITDVGIVL